MKHTIFNPAEYLEHNGNNKPDNKSTANGSNATNDNAHNTTHCDNLNATHCDNRNATPHDNHYTTPDDTLARVAEVADRVAASGRDITQGYDNWLRLAFALSDGLGEAGRQIFDRLSQMNADYDTRECNRLYDNCMKGHKGGITIATFFQMARDLANVDLKEMARERGKREEKSLQNCTTCPTCPNVPMSHITKNKCNKKDNILIYNNLGKTTISCWDNGTMGQVGQFCKDFSNGYTFSDKLDTADLPPILKRIMQLHDDVVSRDKMIIGTLNIVSGLIGAASGTPDMPSGVYGLYDGRKVYAPLYNILFANAGSSKGDLNFCRQLAKPLKDEMRREYEGKKMEYERLMAAYEAKRKQKDKGDRGEPPVEPVFRTPFVPGNSSSSAVYRAIDANGGWGLMFETEADTVSAMISSDYGNYSDLMRKAFHHETISMNRVSEKLHIDVDSPRLSVMLTCTPGQLQPLFPNWENGLGSRFFFYQFPEEEPRFNNVFARNTRPFDEEYLKMGESLLKLYHALEERKGRPVQFVMSSNQQESFLASFQEMLKDQYEMLGSEYKAFVYRLALGGFRYAMVLSTLRRLATMTDLGGIFQPEESAMVCDDRDFATAMTIVETLANHTARVYTRLAKETENPFADKGIKLTPEEIKIYNKLPDDKEFKASDYIAIAQEQNISRASAYRLINLFCNAYGIIIPTRYGHYRKAAAGNDDASQNGGTEAQTSGTEPQSGGTENESN
ncbi:hypothetical protein ST44_01595 [Prevotella pectinovora]|uniref:Primase C-terminal 2 domain-containing protein n=1 Tax=Prevotella pectinovora TaxID=1602169 RepID=A0A0D0IWI7_9BACT|nr:DUF3987 domain-containing protein [Prevotella pectinovora]KIP64632.1 hypothetical protein ST44_01595 [Prevotella pectinovora]